jgi:hypothetical protein
MYVLLKKDYVYMGFILNERSDLNMVRKRLLSNYFSIIPYFLSFLSEIRMGPIRDKLG